MTKQEKIIEAYAELGLPFHENIIYDNGWTRIKPNQYSSKYGNCDLLKLNIHTHSIRPKSLQGIENNNGWIKIESESDLPKDGYVFWTKRDGFNNPMYRYIDIFTEEENKYWLENYTHYQPIQKPLNPIY